MYLYLFLRNYIVFESEIYEKCYYLSKVKYDFNDIVIGRYDA